MEFVTLYRPHRIKDRIPDEAGLERIKGGYALKAKLTDGWFTALLPTDEHITLKGHGLESKGAIKCQLKRAGEPAKILGLGE
jgi:hypothetical protein